MHYLQRQDMFLLLCVTYTSHSGNRSTKKKQETTRASEKTDASRRRKEIHLSEKWQVVASCVFA